MSQILNIPNISKRSLVEARSYMTVLLMITLIYTLSITGCNRPRNQLFGVWTVDIEALNNAPQVLKIAPPAGPLAQKWKANMVRDWVFRFNKDQSLEMNFQGAHYQGRYEITSEAGNTIFIRTEMRPLPSSGLDALLGVNPPKDNVIVERFSISFANNNIELSLEDFTPIKIRRSPLGV